LVAEEDIGNEYQWTEKVQAHAIITLGKLCLKAPKLARNCVSVFSEKIKVQVPSIPTVNTRPIVNNTKPNQPEPASQLIHVVALHYLS